MFCSIDAESAIETTKRLFELARTPKRIEVLINFDEEDFDIDALKKYFDKDHFFIKLSPINPNEVSNSNDMGTGAVEGVNLV